MEQISLGRGKEATVTQRIQKKQSSSHRDRVNESGTDSTLAPFDPLIDWLLLTAKWFCPNGLTDR